MHLRCHLADTTSSTASRYLHYLHHTGVLCKFGDQTVPSVIRGDGFITCVAPASAQPGTLPLEFSLNNGADFSHYSTQWRYHALGHVASLDPAWGGSTGGTTVKLSGGPYPYESAAAGLLNCSFAAAVVPARWLSESEIACDTPPLQPVAEVQTVHVSALAYAPEVVQLSLSAAAPANEVHTISTYNDPTVCAYLARLQ
jgi:hypothetical protein